MENRFKLRISRMFRSSFGSCRSRNTSDVLEKAVFTPQNHKNFRMIEPLSPKPRPFPSICRPRCPETRHMIIDHTCIEYESAPRRKVSEQYSPFALTTSNGRMCPPASPISPLNPYYESKDQFEFRDRDKKKDSVKNKKKKRTRNARKTKKRSDNMCIFSSSSQESFNYTGWWSSTDDEKEDETETLFSSRSLSSDSSESLRRRCGHKRQGTRSRKAASKSSDQIGILPLSEGKVKDSFAVVKRSSDPYNDFRTSMVEMIVEKQIFAAKDLEQLLQCFLSLNSYHHHRIILEVFTEIWEALFSNWC